MISKRSYRRIRHKVKEHKRNLDIIAKAKIQESMIWSMDTWGGTRCPGCGLNCRPHHLTNLSNFLVNENNKVIGHYTAYGDACSYIKCKGLKEWW
jgi:hypothetical protein